MAYCTPRPEWTTKASTRSRRVRTLISPQSSRTGSPCLPCELQPVAMWRQYDGPLPDFVAMTRVLPCSFLHSTTEERASRSLSPPSGRYANRCVRKDLGKKYTRRDSNPQPPVLKVTAGHLKTTDSRRDNSFQRVRGWIWLWQWFRIWQQNRFWMGCGGGTGSGPDNLQPTAL